MRFLLADDSVAMRRIQCETIRQLEGVEVVEASDGVGALFRLREVGYDVDMIIADSIMPRMDGLALAKVLKSTPNLSKIPVLLVVGSTDEIKFGEAWMAGVDGYLLKPFTSEQLLRAIVSLAPERMDPGRSEQIERMSLDLGETSVLRRLPAGDRKRLLDACAFSPMPRGARILEEQRLPSEFVVVAEGLVEEYGNEGGGPKRLLRTYGPGECLGVVELMAGDPIRSFFMAAEPTTIASMPRANLERLLEDMPTLSVALVRALASKVSTLESHGNFHSSDMGGRLGVLDLPSLIQAINLRKRSCIIEFPEVQGMINCLHGEVVSAVAPGQEGKAAFFHILRSTATQFRLIERAVPTRREIHCSTSRLLSEAAACLGAIYDEQGAAAK